MRKRVVVTGLGCVSPVGNNVKDSWEALLAGRSGAAPIQAFDASHHKKADSHLSHMNTNNKTVLL